jgi:murein tripeptide amidase MpaA
MSVQISSEFDSGAIEVVNCETTAAIELRIRRDANASFSQWFYFRLQGVADSPCSIRFLNASETSFPKGWEGYQAVASYDRETWFRVPTTYDGLVMTITHTPAADSVYYAYFEPYPHDRHERLLERTLRSPRAQLIKLGETTAGRDLNLVVIGGTKSTKSIWIIARQHPGESMAEWFVEGLVDELLNDGTALLGVLEAATFYIVPNMNPDGSILGNIRTNAAGVDLNREWIAPSMERSPEVFLVREKMHNIGCNLFLDIHGEEVLPYVFVDGGASSEYSSTEEFFNQERFVSAFKNASADFQDEYGYEKQMLSDISIASKYVAKYFKCISFTLEMPFKDNAFSPNSSVGWNGKRSAQLGAAILKPIDFAMRTMHAALDPIPENELAR